MQMNDLVIIIKSGNNKPKLKRKFIEFKLENDEITWKNEEETIKNKNLVNAIKDIYYKNKETLVNSAEAMKAEEELTRLKGTAVKEIEIVDGDFNTKIDCYITDFGKEPGTVVDQIIRTMISYFEEIIREEKRKREEERKEQKEQEEKNENESKYKGKH